MWASSGLTELLWDVVFQERDSFDELNSRFRKLDERLNHTEQERRKNKQEYEILKKKLDKKVIAILLFDSKLSITDELNF